MKAIDIFGLLNLGLFGALCVLRYHDRFVRYRGALHIEEFYFYAVMLLLGIAILWRWFRHFDLRWPIMLALQWGITMHFLGAFVQWDGARLYDAHLAGLRYDKYVHATNAFAVALLVSRLLSVAALRSAWIHALAVVLVVLGLGAVVEIVEYLVVLTVPEHGVGGYDNNMQDLIANALGASLAMAMRGVWRAAWPVPDRTDHAGHDAWRQSRANKA